MSDSPSPGLVGTLSFLRERSAGQIPGTPLTLSKEGAQEIVAEIARLQAEARRLQLLRDVIVRHGWCAADKAEDVAPKLDILLHHHRDCLNLKEIPS